MHPTEMLSYWARVAPDRPAIIEPQMAITYGGLAAAVGACTRRIQQLDLPPGEPVGLVIPDRTRLLAVSLAMLHLGITFGPIMPSAVEAPAGQGFGTLIFAPGSPVLPSGRNIPFDDSWLRGESASVQRPARQADSVFFTSGSTGKPKKVVIPLAAFLHRIALSRISGEVRLGRTLVAPGLASIFGFTRVTALVMAGKTAILASNFSRPMRAVEAFQADSMVASPQQALALVEMLEAQPSRLESVREVRIGGGALTAELAGRIRNVLCRNVVTEYGATEAGLIAWAPYDVVRDNPGAVGIVVPGMQLDIVDENDRPLPPGVEGRIRGLSAYTTSIARANAPDRVRDGEDVWWYPGDLGRLDASGILSISGRADDVINCGGMKIAAAEIDDLVRRLPGVRDAAACGILGPSGIEEVWIAFTSDQNPDPNEIVRRVEGSRNFQIKVGGVHQLPEIPRNELGKLQRHELKTLLMSLPRTPDSAPSLRFAF